LIDAASANAEKQLSLGVVRYPGGLRADEEDWQKTLKAKDFNVDTDEFLDWCQKMSCRPMFTANVGDGSPELAAAWVKYVNQTRKGPKVQLWEIGNEIYGDWHKYYAKWGKDGGKSYGKAVRDFVKAMKAVDPSIKVSAVWMLSGAWNQTVFKEVADVVDAVSVHHYAQHAGSEDDQALLAVSAESDALVKDVQKQVNELGVKGKKYEIWLTEWNSVDQNPGAQILQHVNGLFVADYLGHLAQSPVQVANLWALYNGRDKRLGDYSLLSPNGDPQGFNLRRPSYWAFEMLANTLTGNLLEGATDQEALSGFMSRRSDGKLSLVFVNKSFDTDYKTTLKLAGLKGDATVETLSAESSGGLVGPEATGKTHAASGPKSEKVSLADGAQLVVPKASIVTVRF
jgi:alpha-L-arabinofuranosidase